METISASTLQQLLESLPPSMLWRQSMTQIPKGITGRGSKEMGRRDYLTWRMLYSHLRKWRSSTTRPTRCLSRQISEIFAKSIFSKVSQHRTPLSLNPSPSFSMLKAKASLKITQPLVNKKLFTKVKTMTLIREKKGSKKRRVAFIINNLFIQRVWCTIRDLLQGLTLWTAVCLRMSSRMS